MKQNNDPTKRENPSKQEIPTKREAPTKPTERGAPVKRERPTQQAPRSRGRPPHGLRVTDELLAGYWDSLRAKGVREATLATYQRRLGLLWETPDECRIDYGTLEAAVERLLGSGYAHQTVNMVLTVANGLLDFAGRRELQYVRRLETDAAQPTLTRAEYLRLLSAARILGKERTYLLVKVFATLGLDVQTLPALTAEVARSGIYTVGGRTRPLPKSLRTELLSYAEVRGVLTGPLFLTEERQPMSRTYITNSIKQLSRAARVDEEKCNPRCLKRLCQLTRDVISADLSLLVEQAHERLLEEEQRSIGWGRK